MGTGPAGDDGGRDTSGEVWLLVTSDGSKALVGLIWNASPIGSQMSKQGDKQSKDAKRSKPKVKKERLKDLGVKRDKQVKGGGYTGRCAGMAS